MLRRFSLHLIEMTDSECTQVYATSELGILWSHCWKLYFLHLQMFFENILQQKNCRSFQKNLTCVSDLSQEKDTATFMSQIP